MEIHRAIYSSLYEGKDREVRKEKEVKERRSYAEVMALKVNQAEECFGPLTEPIARVPRRLSEAPAGLLKPGQEIIMHTGSLSKNQNLERPPFKLVQAGLKDGDVSGSRMKESASGVQIPARRSAVCSGPMKLMGRDEAGVQAVQVYSGVSLELLNVKETLCRLKKEIDVGLGKIELAIQTVELGELGQGVRAHSAVLKASRKGKEKVGDGALGPRVARGFKAKKKVLIWKPKSGLGMSMGQARGPRPEECVAGQPRESRTLCEGASSSAGLVDCNVGGPGTSEEAGKGSGEGGLTGRRAGEGGLTPPTLLGTSEAADNDLRLQISLARDTTGVVGSPEQAGMLPARVIEVATKLSGGLGVSEEAGESFGRGGLTGKGIGEMIGGLGSPQRRPMLLFGNSGRLSGGLEASEMAGIPLRLPVVANQTCGEGSSCSQGDDTTQSLMEASPVIGDRMLVPWSPWESNVEGEKGAVACTTPISDPSSRSIGSVVAVKPGRDVNLGSDRHAPLNAYDPNSGNEAGYSDWVIQCARGTSQGCNGY
ncbi:hypothetical protein FH972_012971 [Carpinus fangiana]|uniref:Uncharacterized protein n=1 Tax=Carpinus fangiana TaxID=176857 RepID=A0A5N6R8N4_9ROSI|nr:hypothetical protein FH972_012971 [Carpinus fangiana]